MVRKTFNSNEILKIQEHYKNGLSCYSIGKLFGVSKTPINRVLKDLGVLKKSKSDGKKIVLTETQKIKIKKMYCDEFKNIDEISQKLKLTKSFIDKYLNTVNYRRNKSEAMRVLKTGKKLSENIKKNMKLAQHKFNQSGNKKINGGVCKFYNIKGINCQGTYEKFYIDKLMSENKELPQNCEPILTPYGLYFPDFKINDVYIEIKSDYTFDVLIGKTKNRFTKKFETKQLKKINWVTENIKKVEIIVVDKKNNKLINK